MRVSFFAFFFIFFCGGLRITGDHVSQPRTLQRFSVSQVYLSASGFLEFCSLRSSSEDDESEEIDLFLSGFEMASKAELGLWLEFWED